MKFIITIYTTNKLTVVEMEDIRGVRLRKFKLRKIVLGVRMHFHHTGPTVWNLLPDSLCDPALSSNSFRHSLKTNLFRRYHSAHRASRDAS